jgi:hypothetical protein
MIFLDVTSTYQRTLSSLVVARSLFVTFMWHELSKEETRIGLSYVRQSKYPNFKSPQMLVIKLGSFPFFCEPPHDPSGWNAPMEQVIHWVFVSAVLTCILVRKPHQINGMGTGRWNTN